MYTGDSLSGWWLLWKNINPFASKVRIPNISDIQSQLAYLSCEKMLLEIKRQKYCRYMSPPVKQYGTLEFGSFDAIFQTGYDYGMKEIEKWKREKGNPTPAYLPEGTVATPFHSSPPSPAPELLADGEEERDVLLDSVQLPITEVVEMGGENVLGTSTPLTNSVTINNSSSSSSPSQSTSSSSSSSSNSFSNNIPLVIPSQKRLSLNPQRLASAPSSTSSSSLKQNKNVNNTNSDSNLIPPLSLSVTDEEFATELQNQLRASSHKPVTKQSTSKLGSVSVVSLPKSISALPISPRSQQQQQQQQQAEEGKKLKESSAMLLSRHRRKYSM
jgi:hypothetical protein